MHQTYLKALRELIATGQLDKQDSVIVTCGGSGDRDVLREAGISHAMITNLDRDHAGSITPYDWKYCDAENLPFADDSFDWGFVHAGLHHCGSPHRGFLELLRVSRKGVLVIEARESALIRLAVRLGFTPEYELETIALNGSGGLRGGPIPNFIYRWTEREVRKTLEAAMPGTINELKFFYGLRLPDHRMTMAPGWKQFIYKVLATLTRFAVRLFPKQSNEFGFAVVKTGKRKPWVSGGTDFLETGYRLSFDIGKHQHQANS